MELVSDIKSLTSVYQVLTTIHDGSFNNQAIGALPVEIQESIRSRLASDPSISAQKAVHSVTVEMVKSLDQDLKNRVYEAFYRVSSSSAAADEGWSQYHLADADKTEGMFQALSEVFNLRSIDLDSLAAVFLDKMDEKLVRRAVEAIDSFDGQISEGEESEIRDLLCQLYDNSYDPVLSRLMIERLKQAESEIDRRRWDDLECMLARDVKFDVLGAVLSGAQQTLDLEALERNFDELVNTLEVKEPRLSDDIDQKRDEEWAARKISWDSFKERIRSYSPAMLFDGSHPENRKRQYYALGVRFIAAAIAASNEESLGYCLDNIDRQQGQSFLATCRTGWIERIAQLEAFSGVKPKDTLLQVWGLSRDVRRSLVNRYVAERFSGGSVHNYEKAKAAVNQIFNLGYSADDLGIADDGSNELGIDYADLYLYIQKHFTSEFLDVLAEELKKKSPEEVVVLFNDVLVEYFAAAKENPSLLIDPPHRVESAVNSLVSWGHAHPECTKEALGELSSIKNVLSAYFSDISIKTRLTYQDYFFTKIASTAAYGKMKIDRTLHVDKKIELFKEKLVQMSPEIRARFTDNLAELDELMTKDRIEFDFTLIKKSISSFVQAYPALVADINKELLCEKLQGSPKFAAMTLAILSKCLKVTTDECSLVEGRILSMIQGIDLSESMKDSITCQITKYADAQSVESVKNELIEMVRTRHVEAVIEFFNKPTVQHDLLADIRANNMKNIVICLESNKMSIIEWTKGIKLASDTGNSSVLDLLLQFRGIQNTSEEEKEYLAGLTYDGALKLITKHSDERLLKLLPVLLGENSISTFLKLAEVNNLQLFKLLLASDICISMDDRQSAIEFAVQNNSSEMVRLLLSEGVEISDECRQNAVWGAASANNLDMVKFLLIDGFNMSKEIRGLCLLNGTQYNNLELVKFLLQDGVELSNDHMGQAVVQATTHNSIELVQFLVVAGGCISSHYIEAAIEIAKKNKNAEIESLLRRGPNLDNVI